MATKKYLELQEFSDSDLVSELEQTELQYQKLQFDHVIKGIENPLMLREIRRDIARLNTEVRRRQINAMSSEELANRSKIRERRRRK
ncbi:MAG TPA: 50S ribosomal protein L29 [Saprospiraceae bacterium]|nr:50S ribosomal protein L29 [Saprospiraceae bacterium]HMP13748.1 50S ribosomal protein L29 [Saprospiraceae bacterium]